MPMPFVKYIILNFIDCFSNTFVIIIIHVRTAFLPQPVEEIEQRLQISLCISTVQITIKTYRGGKASFILKWFPLGKITIWFSLKGG